MYIPVCPVTESNAEYLVRQRDAFVGGFPGPNFPGGKGESAHVGRPTVEDLKLQVSEEALGGMGLAKLNTALARERPGAQKVVARANEILAFA